MTVIEAADKARLNVKRSMSDAFSLPPGLCKGDKNNSIMLRENIMHSTAPESFVEEIFVNELVHLIW